MTASTADGCRRRPPTSRRSPAVGRRGTLRCRLACVGLARGLALLPSPARLARRRLRGRQVVGEHGGDLLDLAELLAGAVEQAVRPRRVAVGRREQRGADGQRQRLCDLDEPCHVLLVTVPARVRDGTEQPLRLRELLAGAAILDLAGGARELPRPAGEDLLGRVGLPFAHGAQQRADAGGAVLLPRRRLGDERDEVVEVGPLDRGGDPVCECRHAQPPVRVLGGADGEERLQRSLARPALRELARELGALVEADLPAGDGCPEALLVVVEELRVDALPLALDHEQAACDVRRHGHEPRRRREPAAGPALLAAARGGRDARALPVEVGVEQRVQRDDAVVVRRPLR